MPPEPTDLPAPAAEPAPRAAPGWWSRLPVLENELASRLRRLA